MGSTLQAKYLTKLSSIRVNIRPRPNIRHTMYTAKDLSMALAVHYFVGRVQQGLAVFHTEEAFCFAPVLIRRHSFNND